MPMPSATVAMNTVLRSWQRKVCPGPKHRALSLSVAYGSTKKLLSKLSQESGFQLDEAVVNFPLASEEELLQALEAALHPETALVVLDLVPSNAPFVLPWDEAIALIRSRSPDAFILADAAHGLFGLPLKLSGPCAIKADALVSNCHKWFCGPKGTAVLHVAPQHQEWIEPLVISHGFGTDFPSGFYWPGLTDFSSWLALDEALEFWDLVGLDPARLYCTSMVTEAAEMLAESWGTALAFPSEMIGTMAAVELPIRSSGEASYVNAEAVQNALFQRNIEVPVKVLSGKLHVRISAHIYNHIEEYEILRDAVLDLKSAPDF